MEGHYKGHSEFQVALFWAVLQPRVGGFNLRHDFYLIVILIFSSIALSSFLSFFSFHPASCAVLRASRMPLPESLQGRVERVAWTPRQHASRRALLWDSSSISTGYCNPSKHHATTRLSTFRCSLWTYTPSHRVA